MKIDKNEYLALFHPINPNTRLDNIDFFLEWTHVYPLFTPKVYLIFYLGFLDKEFTRRLLRGHVPLVRLGRVVHKEDFEVICTYPCFSGSSPCGLNLCFGTGEDTPWCGIHLRKCMRLRI